MGPEVRVASISPIRIVGRWQEGYALDYHVVSSVYIGDDEFGHAQFDTKRSELGELLYRLKYRSDMSVVSELAEAAARFVRSWVAGMEVVVPVPPTRSARTDQPVLVIARALADLLGLPVGERAVAKARGTPQLKDVYDYNERLSLLAGAFRVESSQIRGRRVLLLDDLYRSGATMNAVASALCDEGGAAAVYALAMTRTRRG